MGGLGKHINSLWEDTSLTFTDLGDIADQISSAEGCDVYEKTDGQNLFVTWDFKSNTLRCARNKGNLLNGGMSIKELSKKFADKKAVHDAYVNGANALEASLKQLVDSIKKKIFDVNVWYSIEIIAKDNPNVIHYDADTIAFHRFGPKVLSENEFVDLSDKNVITRLDVIDQNLIKMNEVSHAKHAWKIVCPLKIDLKAMNDNKSLTSFLEKIHSIKNLADLDDRDTIRTYLFNRMMQEKLKGGPLSRPKQLELVSRLLEDEGCQTKTYLLKKADSAIQRNFIVKMLDQSVDIIHEFMKPIETAIFDLSVDRMNGLASLLISDNEKEIKRIKFEVDKMIKLVEKSNDAIDRTFVANQLKRLGSIDNIKTTIEGLTFKYKGKVFKMTGAFAPVNQILGLHRFKRVVK